MSLAGKKIAVGVTGGIAAYKAAYLVRELRKAGAEVRVAMTRSATEFVAELTFATLSENPVSTTLLSGNETRGTAHIDLARWCDIFVVCPATANFLAKAAAGIADDLITTTVLATEARVVVCPAMNSVMWRKEIVQENLAKVQKLGFDIVRPEWGQLATTSEGEGWGRLASTDTIIDRIERFLLTSDELKGVKVVVTAGPTREAIDPVRFLTNYSSGKMGFALAEAASRKGAHVALISGPNSLRKLDGVKYVEIVSVADLEKAVDLEYADCDILLMSAAVSDYRPRKEMSHKIKKESSAFHLKMEKSPDILERLGKKKGDRLHVGFALETQDGVANAKQKLERKNLDLVVLNNPLQPGAAFAGDTNVVSIIDREGPVETLPMMSKRQVADVIVSRLCEMRKGCSEERAAG